MFTVQLMYVPISKCKKILKKINKHSLWNLKAERWLLLIKTFNYIFKIKVCKSFVRTYKPSESVHNTPFVVIVLHPFHTYNLLNKSLIFTLRKTLRNSSEFFFLHHTFLTKKIFVDVLVSLFTLKDQQKSEDCLEPNIAKRIRYLELTLASFLSTELHVVLYVCYANVMCVHQIRFLKAHWVNASSLCTLAHNPMSLLNWPGWVLVLYFLIDLNAYSYLLALNIRIRNDLNFFLIRTMAMNHVSYWFKWCLLSHEIS